jgi:periplasmic divalent cation tolerance protein
MSSSVLIGFCTCPDSSSADRISEALVSEGYAACVNQISGIKSTFLWQGSIEQESEILLLVKTTEDRFPALVKRVRELHPYELPEIIAVPVTAGLPEYLQWIDACTSAGA